MDVIRKDYNYDSREDDTVTIVGLGDIHRGNPWLDEKRFYRTLDWIEEHNCYVILMGDYGECINSKDPRHDYNAIDWEYSTPDKQYKQTRDDLERIKDKCIMMLEGNHESNFWRRHNHNYTEWLATDLGIPYPGISGYVLFRFKRKAGKSYDSRIFRIYAHHGWAGGRTDGYKVKVIQDLTNIFDDANAYMMGHTHRLGEVFPTTRLYIDNRTASIRERHQKYFYTGSYIKGHEKGRGSYVEARAYPPTQLGSLFMEVRPQRVDTGRDKSKPKFDIRCMDMDWLL